LFFYELSVLYCFVHISYDDDDDDDDRQELLMLRAQLLTMNECTSNPCRNGATCVDQYNGYLCQCSPGWQGPLCDQDVNECSTLAGTDLGCQNGATCLNTQGSFRSVCVSFLCLHHARLAQCSQPSRSFVYCQICERGILKTNPFSCKLA